MDKHQEVEYFCSGKLYSRSVSTRIGIDNAHVSTGYFSFHGVAKGDNVKAGEIFDYCLKSIRRDYNVGDSSIHIETLTIYR